ncbi:transposable element Tc1 transposase [Trichonephila clavipes]|nr:transposable element Tc1 transposase [Trichonephila clavipes]
MVWGAIAYHVRSQLLRIVGNLNSTRYINEVLQPQAISFLQGLPGALFQQGNARPLVAKTVKSYLDSQQVQLHPWPAHSPDMSQIEHVWDIVGRRLARTSKTNFGCAYKQYGILFHRQIFKICLTPCRVM